MKLIAILSLVFFAFGCTTGPHPTTQQTLDAQQGNQFIAHAARLGFEVLATNIELDRAAGKINPSNDAQINAAEDAIKGLLNQMDAAALGDPNQFTELVRLEAVKQGELWLQFQLIHLLTPRTVAAQSISPIRNPARNDRTNVTMPQTPEQNAPMPRNVLQI